MLRTLNVVFPPLPLHSAQAKCAEPNRPSRRALRARTEERAAGEWANRSGRPGQSRTGVPEWSPVNCFLIHSIISLCLLVSVATAAEARTIVVSPAGNDAAAGNAEKPLRTISAAASLAQPGDTILVKPGVYRERVTPPRGGEPGKPITYRGEKLGTVFIRGSEEWKPSWQQHAGKVFFAVPAKGCDPGIMSSKR